MYEGEREGGRKRVRQNIEGEMLRVREGERREKEEGERGLRKEVRRHNTAVLRLAVHLLSIVHLSL